MYESYLPLLPLTIDTLPTPTSSYASSGTAYHVDLATGSPRVRASIALPLSCSVSALRGSFVPIPFKFQSNDGMAGGVGVKRVRGESGERRLEERVRKNLKVGLELGSLGKLRDEGVGFIMREMRRADVPSVKLLQDACLPVVYPPSFYTILLTTNGFVSYLVHSTPSSISSIPPIPIGFVSARLLSSNTIYLLSLVVLPGHRRTGVARRLLEKAAGECEGGSIGQKEVLVKLHVAVSNTVARDFYRRVLTIDGSAAEEKVLRGFYKGVGDAVEMQGRLKLG